MRGVRDNPADADLAGELGIERVGHIVLSEIAGSPAGDVEEPVVDRQIDIGNERGDCLEAFEQRRPDIRIGGFGGNLDDLLDRLFVAIAIPGPDRAERSLRLITALTKP
jgi:hypothetical protein